MKHKYPNETLGKLTVASTEERSRWLTQIFQHSNEAIFLIDLARDKILEVNPKACQLLQYEARELLSLPISTLYPHQKSRLTTFAQTVSDQGQGRTDELYCLTRSGDFLDVEISASTIQIEGRSCLLMLVNDVSNYKQLEKTLQEAEKKYQQITENVNETEAELHRRNQELTLLNRVIAASTAKREVEAILETVCQELATAFNVPQATAVLLNKQKTIMTVVAQYLAEGRSPLTKKLIPIEENSLAQHLLQQRTPVVIADIQNNPLLVEKSCSVKERKVGSLLVVPLLVEGEVVGGLGLEAAEANRFSSEEINLAWSVAEQVAGVLARVRLDEERRQWEEQYHQAQKLEAVGRLTTGIAHDFNNILTAINGFGELLQAELLPDDPLREMTDKILRSGRHATDLVRQLLVFSRKQIIEPRRLTLNMIVAEMDKMLQRVIGEDIELKTVLAPDLWMVKADASQIEQVILNLAINARDAMPEGGRLTIETNNLIIDEGYAAGHLGVQPGDYVLLALSDTGYGMSPEVKAHIFEPFFTTKEIGKGTGLGLATVFGIVKQNGGDIWVYSEEGFGTAFKIYLPRAEQATLPLASPEIGAEMPTGDETILLVEDDLAVREVARRVLQRQGYTLLEAQRGKEALQLLTQHPSRIHLLLTDVIMPEISGKELYSLRVKSDVFKRLKFEGE
jgi:PAS domain S-box-containing protein